MSKNVIMPHFGSQLITTIKIFIPSLFEYKYQNSEFDFILQTYTVPLREAGIRES